MECTRSITFTLPSKNGSPSTRIKVTEVNGALFFEVAMLSPTSMVDLRGLFFDLNDDSKMAGLLASGSGGKVTDFDTVDVIDLGQGANMYGAAPPFDVGLEFGTAGAKDIIQSVSFTLSNAANNLTLDDIAHTMFGAKIDGIGGGGSAKPTVIAPAASDAQDDSYNIFEDGQSGLNDPSKVPEGVVFQVLANDTDADGDTLAVTDVHGALHGTLTIVDGDDADLLVGDAVLYTPFLDYAGTDSFEYCITDNNGGTDFAQVNVTVAAVADVPLLSYVIAAGAVVNEILITVTATQNDADNSEFIDRIELSGLPAGVTALPGSVNPGTQPGQLVQQFVLTLPFNADTNFDLGINAYSEELSNGDQQVGTVSVPIVYEFNRNEFDESYTAADQSIWLTGDQFELNDPDRFIGFDEHLGDTYGEFLVAQYHVDITAGFRSNLHFEGGEIDATVPYDITIDTNYNKTTDVLQIGGNAFVAPGAMFTTEGPEGSYKLDFIFAFGVGAGLVLDLGVLGEYDIYGFNVGLDPINENILDVNSEDAAFEFDLPAGFSASFDWPDLETTSLPAAGSPVESEGASNNFLELGLDVDDLVFAILGSPVNPFDLPFDVGFAEGSIELLDFDVNAGLNFLQEFAMSVTDLTGTITFENGASQAFNFASDILLNNASSYDTDLDGKVEFALALTPQATLNNNTDLGVNFGAQFDVLTIAGSYDLEVDTGTFELGPIISLGGSTTLTTVDLYNETFGLNFESGDITFLA